MKSERTAKKIIGTVSSFFIFFLMVAAVIACCLMLFTSTLQSTIGHRFTEEEITAAA